MKNQRIEFQLTREQLIDLLSLKLQLKRLKPKPENIQACCPSHTESRPSWGISVHEGHVHNCFTCGYSGVVQTLVADVLGLTLVEAMTFLGENYITNLDHNEVLKGRNFVPYEELATEVRATPVYPDYTLALYRKVHPYTINRGFTLETASKYEIGYDQEHQRIVIPVRNSAGGLVGIIGRVIAADTPGEKYMVYWNFSRGSLLYMNRGEPPKKKLLVVESPIDVPWLDQAGLCKETDVGAVMSSKATAAQMDLMAGYEEVTLCLDKDQWGLMGESKIIDRLMHRTRLMSMVLPEGCKDPGECQPDVLVQAWKDRKSVLMHKVANLSLILD